MGLISNMHVFFGGKLSLFAFASRHSAISYSFFTSHAQSLSLSLSPSLLPVMRGKEKVKNQTNVPSLSNPCTHTWLVLCSKLQIGSLSSILFYFMVFFSLPMSTITAFSSPLSSMDPQKNQTKSLFLDNCLEKSNTLSLSPPLAQNPCLQLEANERSVTLQTW